jgi:hypothetical protein
VIDFSRRVRCRSSQSLPASAVSSALRVVTDATDVSDVITPRTRSSWLHKNAASAPTGLLARIALGTARGIAHLHAEGACVRTA